MPDTQAIIQQAYTAFNQRNIDSALALMTEDVSWPRASVGGKVIGKDQIRDYWTTQWAEFDPHVEPIEITEKDGNQARVRVHQVVKNIAGKLLADGEVLHIFTLDNGLIKAMELGDQAGAAPGPTAAFAHRP